MKKPKRVVKAKCPICGAGAPDVTMRGKYPKKGGYGQRYYCHNCKNFFHGPLENV